MLRISFTSIQFVFTFQQSASSVPNILKFTELYTLSLEKCQEEINKHPDEDDTLVFESNVCTTSAKGVGICFGDSGQILNRRR